MSDGAAGRARRREMVAGLVRSGSVASQEQIVERLAAAGLVVNQATVSRDLEELGAYKARRGGAYALPEPEPDALRRVMREWVRGVEAAGPLVVVKTAPASAHVVAVALDAAGLDAVMGTIAGDDAIFVAVQGGADAGAVATRLRALAGMEGDA